MQQACFRVQWNPKTDCADLHQKPPVLQVPHCGTQGLRAGQLSVGACKPCIDRKHIQSMWHTAHESRVYMLFMFCRQLLTWTARTPVHSSTQNAAVTLMPNAPTAMLCITKLSYSSPGHARPRILKWSAPSQVSGSPPGHHSSC